MLGHLKLGSARSIERANPSLPALMPRQRNAVGFRSARCWPGRETLPTISGLSPSSASASRARALSWARPARRWPLSRSGNAVSSAPWPSRLRPFLQVVRQEAIAADRHDARRRRGDADRAGRAVEPRGIIGIDMIARRLRHQRVARRRRRRIGGDRQPSARAAPAFPSASAESRRRSRSPAARAARRAVRAGSGTGAPSSASGGRRTVRLRRTDRRRSASPAGPARTRSMRPVPARAKAPITLRSVGSRAGMSSLAQPQRQRRRRNQHIAGMLVDLLLQHLAVEGMMQRQRSARQQPDHQRRGEARERRRRERRHHGRALRHVAFERTPQARRRSG